MEKLINDFLHLDSPQETIKKINELLEKRNENNFSPRISVLKISCDQYGNAVPIPDNCKVINIYQEKNIYTKNT